MILIFDFDGVLADSRALMLSIAEQACLKLGFKRRPVADDLEALERMEFVELGRQLGLPPESIEDFSRYCLVGFNGYTGVVPIFPGMQGTLQKLSEIAKIAIITGNSRLTVQGFLQAHQIDRFVDLIMAVEEPGSRADKIRAVIEKLHGTPARTYMIGDAVSDVKAARQAGVKSIAVCWGHQSKKRLMAEKPDQVAETPEDLLRLTGIGPEEDRINGTMESPVP